MRINNNIMAMNTHRQYGINNNNISKSIEKLSSGYRINRAGDDAAGLAISEKMRAQIRGLQMASKNSQDAISLVQTAEGALQESHNILQRMRELAVQSASDTNETTIDRGALEQEFQQLIKELDDTANKTRFNDQNLIDGTFALKNATGTYNGQGVVRTGPKAVDGTYTVQASYTDAVTEIKSAGKAGTVNTGGLYASSAFSKFEFDFASLVAGTNPTGSDSFTVDDDSVATISNVVKDSPTTVSFTVDITNSDGDTNQYSYTLQLDPAALVADTGVTGSVTLGDQVKLDYTINGGTTIDQVVAALEGMQTSSQTIEDAATSSKVDFASSALVTVSADTLEDGTLPKTAAMNGTWTLTADASDLGAVTFTLTHGETGKQINSIVDLSAYDYSAGDSVTLDFGDQLGTITLALAANGVDATEGDAAMIAALDEFNASFTITGGVDAKTETTPASAKITVDGNDIELKAGMTGFQIEGKDISVAFDRALTADDLASEAALSAFLGGLETEISVETKDGKALIIQTGANEGDNLAINIDKMDSGYLGVAISSIATRDQASAAITQVNDAINQVSTQRAALGALQNRLDHKIANLDTSAENLQAAESRIRDLDMAKEMTEFTKNNILAQAATAMLAQANALPQGVLQLLQ